MNDVVTVGAWRNGFIKQMRQDIDNILERQDKGFRLFPPESIIVELVSALDAYDLVLPDLAECHVRCAEESNLTLEAL